MVEKHTGDDPIMHARPLTGSLIFVRFLSDHWRIRYYYLGFNQEEKLQGYCYDNYFLFVISYSSRLQSEEKFQGCRSDYYFLIVILNLSRYNREENSRVINPIIINHKVKF